MTTFTATDAVSNTTGTAAFINGNFAALETVLNGDLDNANFKSDAAIGVSKLAPGGVRTRLEMVSGVPTWTTGPVVYDRAPGVVQVVNTTTATSIYSKTITGQDMGLNRMLRLTLAGEVLKNATGTLTGRVVLGGAIEIARAVTITNDGFSRGWMLQVTIQNQGAANNQWGTYRFRVSNDAPDVLDVHDLTSLSMSGDTGQDTALEITMQWSAASNSLNLVKRTALLELI